LTGTNLLNVTSVKLQKSGESDISATGVTVISSSQITCSFNLAGKTAGVWNVKVINNNALSGEGTSLFTIYPVAEFTGTPITGSAPLLVSFEDSSAGNPSSWSWVFGDSNTSILQNPTHTYVANGTYSIYLTVSNGGASNSTTQSFNITVS
jgi:PKD repeat protein